VSSGGVSDHGREHSWYLGHSFERDREEVILHVSQRPLVKYVVSQYGIDAEWDLPASQSANLGPRRNGESVCDKPVRAAVSGLIWLRSTMRPDIASAIRAVVPQALDAAERHWCAVRKVIVYLNETKDLDY